jgi:hypothetical protein
MRLVLLPLSGPPTPMRSTRPVEPLCYRTNLMPKDFPRRQTTSQARPVLASRANASRNLAGKVLGSSIVILAPVEDISRTMHRRAAKPPSRVIHPGRCSDLRASRFFVAAIPLLPALHPLIQGTLETVETSQEIRAVGGGTTFHLPPKRGVPGGLPGCANAIIRSPAATGINSPGSGFGSAPSPAQSVDLPDVFVCHQSETAMPRPVGPGEADVLAPFVYRLGRHPFTVERAVRFR